MRKSSVVMLCIIAVLIGGICGFFIGSQADKIQDASLDSELPNDMVGTYRTHAGSEDEAVIVLKENGTFMRSNSGSNGTWSIDGDTLHFVYDDSNYTATLTVVPEGILWGNCFYEKVE